MTITTNDNSLRRVAILVASLDEDWADRILASLTPQQARVVWQHVEQLSDVDLDEQREVLADFRRSLAQPVNSTSQGVELDASLQERIDHENYSTAAPIAATTQGPLENLSTDDVETLATMLGTESPQTVAVVLSRLNADRAAEVLNRFNVAQQNQILDRLADLDMTDEHAIRVVDAQVAQWLTTQRQRRERMAVGKRMVEELMSRKPVSAEPVIVAGRIPAKRSPIANEYAQVSARPATPPQARRYEPLPVVTPAKPVEPVNPLAHLSASECIARLEALPDQTLLDALSQCEARLALLALVGVSEKLLKRVTRGLSRRENKLFRQQLRDIGPTRLSDILAAQQEVLQIAAQTR